MVRKKNKPWGIFIGLKSLELTALSLLSFASYHYGAFIMQHISLEEYERLMQGGMVEKVSAFFSIGFVSLIFTFLMIVIGLGMLYFLFGSIIEINWKWANSIQEDRRRKR